MKQLNRNIQAAIRQTIGQNGVAYTPWVIKTLAARFQTSKQRISGNISYLVCQEHSVSMIHSKPHSVLI